MDPLQQSESNQIENKNLSLLKVKFEEAKCGSIVTLEGLRSTVFYINKPPYAGLVCLEGGTVVLCNAKLVKTLCELAEQRSGLSTQCTNQLKGVGRVIARGNYVGYISRRRGSGSRVRFP